MIRPLIIQNGLLASLVCLVLLPSLTQAFISQSDVLTVFLDEEIKKYESFVRDRFHYRLSMNDRNQYFDFTFLNSSHSPASVPHMEDVIDTYEIGEAAVDQKIKIFYQLENRTRMLKYFQRDSAGKGSSFQLGDMEEMDKLEVKFMEDHFGIGVLVYYAKQNDETNKTIWLIHSGTEDSHLHRMDYEWKISSDALNNFGVRIISQTSSEFYFLYYDLFVKNKHAADGRFVNFLAESMVLPHLGRYAVEVNERGFNIKQFVQIPVFCAPDYAGRWDQRLSNILVDAYRESTELGTSFFFLMDSRFDQSQRVCLMNSRDLENAANFNTRTDFYCDKQFKHERCIPKKRLPLNNVVLQFEKSVYERMLVKQIYSKATRTETSIILLLEKGFRQQLQVFNLVQELAADGSYRSKKICFEGIYRLRSQKEEIQDIQLENLTDSLLVITKNYIQRIPIGSFCTAHSFSSCQSVSTCTLRNATCSDPERGKRGCLDPNMMNTSKMNSEEYMCDQETKDVCLVGRVGPQTKSIYKDKLCGENSCRCQDELCVPGLACTFDDVHLTYCFLSKSRLKLTNFEIGQPYEPFATMMISSFITLLTIAFILITFYCCFSMTQSSKKKTAIADLSTIDLSKIDVKEMGN